MKSRMEFHYPVEFIPDGDQVIARLPDVPALTFGDDEEHALQEAEIVLVLALRSYIRDREPIPVPKTKPGPGQPSVTLSPLLTAKAALHNAMLERDMTKVALADKLGVSDTVVHRLLDVYHRSHIGQVESALEALGYHLWTSVAKVA